ncbi:hypothetical protein [Thiovibrio frasassiensis]|uniref:Uncharacterized protein n=1 Tax=Thiovibrio frasassiensis TaxID=2984131 RepID=A0A9X4MEJ4_9BACT|nr:hypothetical protein [Thiovibrio frasassiensis]MDG4474660.1 hypothetical protein [Thiovibrio frasassiensis]
MITYSQLWSIQEPILAMAGVIEGYLHFSGRLRDWRNFTADWWVNLQLIKWSDRDQINAKFLEFFNLVYGEKIFSFRRLISAIVSSILFTFIFYIILTRISIYLGGFEYIDLSKNNYFFEWLGYSDGVIEKLNHIYIAAVLFDSSGINILPDFVSIAETGWILKKATEKNANLPALFILDLFLTSLIWFAGHASGTLYSAYILPGDLALLSLECIKNDYSLIQGNGSVWLSFILTTYTTSIIWFCFVFSILFIGGAKRLSKRAVVILETKWVFELPVLTIVGLLCLLSWPILFFVRVIS